MTRKKKTGGAETNSQAASPGGPPNGRVGSHEKKQLHSKKVSRGSGHDRRRFESGCFRNFFRDAAKSRYVLLDVCDLHGSQSQAGFVGRSNLQRFFADENEKK